MSRGIETGSTCPRGLRQEAHVPVWTKTGRKYMSPGPKTGSVYHGKWDRKKVHVPGD